MTGHVFNTTTGTDDLGASRGPLSIALVVGVVSCMMSLVVYYALLINLADALVLAQLTSPHASQSNPAYGAWPLAVLLLGGLLFAYSMSIISYRSVRPPMLDSRMTFANDVAVAIGCGLMGYVFGAWFSVTVPFFGSPSSSVPSPIIIQILGIVGALSGVGLAVLYLNLSRRRRLVRAPGDAPGGKPA